MLDENCFLKLLKQPESESLDFKRNPYNLSIDSSKADFIKDILCMANTPRENSSYIVLGVAKRPDGTFDLTGLSEHLDDADMQSQFSERVYPVPRFNYQILNHGNKTFGVIEIPPLRIGPCVPMKDFSNKLRFRQVYFRRGSKNDIAGPDDLQRILAWIQGPHPAICRPFEMQTDAWDNFVNILHSFDPAYRYVLIAGPIDAEESVLAPLGTIPWTAVIDFDPKSDEVGLLHAARRQLELSRTLYLAIPGDRIANMNPRNSTLWYFARGLQGRTESLELGSWQSWIRRFKTHLNWQFDNLSGAINPMPVVCIVLWYSKDLLQHLKTTMESALGAFGSYAEYAVITDNPGDLQPIATDFDAKLIDIPLPHLSSGLRTLEAAKPESAMDKKTMLPSISGAPIIVESNDHRWLEEELELVDLNTGLFPSSDKDVGIPFLKGAEIQWYELGLHFDIDRDKTAQIKRQLSQELERKRTVRVNLYHAPGAGGSTVARRLLWDFHRNHPSAILIRCNPTETAERLFRLSSLTGQSILLLVDGAQVEDRKVSDLYDIVRSRSIPVVILQVLRRFKPAQERDRASYLPAELSPAEAQRFLDAYSREVPNKREDLRTISSSGDPRKRTAFYFGLLSFGKEFLALAPYIKTRLEHLTQEQTRILVYLALAHHYAQQPIRAQSFATILGLPKNRPLNLEKVLPSLALELLVELKDGLFRTSHELIALEILEQVFSGSNADRRLWRHNLSTWAKEFADFCRGSDPLPNNELLDVARRVFILRDNIELLGTERASMQTFSQIIEEIPSREGRLAVLQRITTHFPEEAHFWAHLGRYYAVEMENHDEAARCLERAIDIQPDDHVLHHMQGMALRYQTYSLMKYNNPLEEVARLTRKSCDAFERARELKPDNEHGYISEVQLIARVLDYAGKKYGRGAMAYLSAPDTDPYLRESLERAETLLEQVRRNREGEEGENAYEVDCRAKLKNIYGDYGKALQLWDNLLSRQDIYKPPLRRQIIWTYLARTNRSWGDLHQSDVNRIVDLLESNMQEEPSNDKNLRLWIQAVRRLKYPEVFESVIEKVAYWKTVSGSLDSCYYLYILYALQSFSGSTLALGEAKRYIDECRQLARLRRNRHKSFEWLGTGLGLKALVHHSELGEWKTEHDFWEKPERIRRVTGRISAMEAPQAGQIEVFGGLPAFFVPARGGGYSRDRLNRQVEFYLGFSYDGLKAWNVKDAV